MYTLTIISSHATWTDSVAREDLDSAVWSYRNDGCMVVVSSPEAL